MHVAFLRAHNQLVEGGQRFGEARRTLRQHYQHIVLNDFLKRIVDEQIVDETIEQNRVFDPDPDQVFMPLEFSVAAYRFGHSMVRAAYNFNLNFNLSGDPDTTPATLELLFTFSALSGQLGNFETLPDNWIIQWENLVPAGKAFDRTRRIDTKLVEPLFQLTDLRGRPRQEDRARLAVRNLLRGYLLRLPTGQAVAGALQQKLSGVRDIPVLGPNRIRNAAATTTRSRFSRTPGSSSARRSGTTSWPKRRSLETAGALVRSAARSSPRFWSGWYAAARTRSCARRTGYVRCRATSRTPSPCRIC